MCADLHNSLHPLKPDWTKHRTRVKITEFTQIVSPLLTAARLADRRWLITETYTQILACLCVSSISLSTDNLCLYHDKRSDCLLLFIISELRRNIPFSEYIHHVIGLKTFSVTTLSSCSYCLCEN